MTIENGTRLRIGKNQAPFHFFGLTSGQSEDDHGLGTVETGFVNITALATGNDCNTLLASNGIGNRDTVGADRDRSGPDFISRLSIQGERRIGMGEHRIGLGQEPHAIKNYRRRLGASGQASRFGKPTDIERPGLLQVVTVSGVDIA